MVVLTVQAIKCTGMVEYGQIPVAVLRPSGDCISGISAAGTAGADKITDAVCRKGIVIIIQIPLVGPSAADLAVLHSPQTAKTCSLFRNLASVDTQSAGNTVHCMGGILRETVSSSTVLVNLFYLRPDNIKVSPDTFGTKAYGI